MRNLNLIYMKLFISLSLLLTGSAFAGQKSISCETNFKEKSFTIEEHTIAFHKSTSGRSISSVQNSKTLMSQNGFTKTLYIDGNKHVIRINDINHFDSSNDFLAISSPKGHKMTYPINCSVI